MCQCGLKAVGVLLTYFPSFPYFSWRALRLGDKGYGYALVVRVSAISFELGNLSDYFIDCAAESKVRK